MSLALGHVPCLEQGSWESEACVLMLYAGDWHVGADDYRAWRNALGASGAVPAAPPGLVHGKPRLGGAL